MKQSPEPPLDHRFEPVDWSGLKVFPLETRASISKVEDVLAKADQPPGPLSPFLGQMMQGCVQAIRAAKERGASVMLVYGAHLLRNGAAPIIAEMCAQGWITHLATNGAGTIHDWEFAWLGRSTESVEDNVEQGTFGAWDETSRNIHLALMAGALSGEGYGQALGRFILTDGVSLPEPDELRQSLRNQPDHPLSAARADLLQAMMRFGLQGGCHQVVHRWKQASILAQALKHRVPVTVHPGIGYDIITNHPIFNGAVIGRAAEIDFKLFTRAVGGLDGGVVLSVGSAIMGPQVFEKSLSCIHNLRKSAGQPNVKDHSIWVVDLQDGGNWDWSHGEPPKSNPAYYLRFCKSYSRMGGAMQYLQCDNLAFMQHLAAGLAAN